MISDEFEKEFAASMDDLEEIDTINTITIPPPASATALTTSKLAKFKRLPEIAENIATTNVSPSPSDLLYRVPTDVLAASVGGDLRKTVLINNSANEILSSSPLSSTAFLNDIERCDNLHSDVANNNFTNGSKSTDNSAHTDDKLNDDEEEVKSAPRRKFIVTRMDSKVLLRPEAEQLRNLSAKTNAATISFPCSSAINRTPLTSLFATNRSFEPHLDKRFFDTSLIRINANSTQSLNASIASNASSQENSLNIDSDSVWERRKEVGIKPKVQIIVSSIDEL